MTENKINHECERCKTVFSSPNYEDFGVYSRIEFEKEPVFFCKECYQKIVQFEVRDWLKSINKVDKQKALEDFNREFTKQLDLNKEVSKMLKTATDIIPRLIPDTLYSVHSIHYLSRGKEKEFKYLVENGYLKRVAGEEYELNQERI